MNQQTEDFLNALLNVDRQRAQVIFAALAVLPEAAGAWEALIGEALQQIGDGWEQGEYSLAQVYMSSVVCEELIQEYFPRANCGPKPSPRLAIAVLGDYHALGKRMVCSVLHAHGYDVLDLGQGLTVDELVELTETHRVEILLISVLMLPSAFKVQEIRKELDLRGLPVKIIVGGAPFRFDSTLWQQVGADADGKNATDIVDVLTKVVGMS